MEQKTHFVSPEERRSAMRRLMWRDHGFLRKFWTHEYEIAPGVWRSNQPSPERIASWAGRGIKSVLLLRGKGPFAPLTKLEQEACDTHGITLIQVSVAGGGLPSKDSVRDLLDGFASAKKPFVMHCKSGIDRTGLAAFLYLVSETDTPPRMARKQLSFKYLHLNGRRHGILDFLADAFVASTERTGITLGDWIEKEYDPVALTARYRAGEAAA